MAVTVCNVKLAWPQLLPCVNHLLLELKVHHMAATLQEKGTMSPEADMEDTSGDRWRRISVTRDELTVSVPETVADFCMLSEYRELYTHMCPLIKFIRPV